MNIVRKRNPNVGQFLPLYTSKTFTSKISVILDLESLQDNFANKTASQRFK